MADYTINHNIFDGPARKNTGTTSKSTGIDETKLAKEIGKVMGKVSKDSSKSLSSEIGKQIEISLGRILSRQTQGPTGRPEKPISKTDIERIVKNVSLDTANSILAALAKGNKATGPRHSGNVESVFKNMDKQITAAIGKLNTSLTTKTGVSLGPEGSKIIAESIGKAIRATVSTELGKSVQEASKTYQSIQRSANATAKAVEAISKLKKSGGGIDVTEIPKVIKSLVTLSKEARDLSNDYKELRTSVKALSKEQDGIVRELGVAIKETKASIASRVSSAIKDIPSKLLDVDKFKKVFDDFLNKFDKVSKQLEVEYKPGQKQLPAPEIKQLETTLKDTGKQVAVLNKSIETLSKSTKPGTSVAVTDTGKELKESFKDIVKLINDVRKDYKSGLLEIAKEVKAGTKDKSVLENFSKDFDSLIKAVESFKPTEIKEAAGRGSATGANSKKLDQIRVLINDVQKKINKPPAESDKEIVSGLKDATNKLTGAAEALEEAAKQLPKTSTTTSQPIEQGSREISPLIKSMQIMSSRLRGPGSINTYPEVALPASKAGLNLKFEGSATKGQERQKQLVQDRINSLSSSLFELQNYIVDTMEKEFADAGKRWAVVRTGTEKSVTEFFKLVKGSNIKSAGKQFGFDIVNIEAVKKQLLLKGRGAATKGTPASMVKELTDAISSEISSSLPNTGTAIDKVAKWLKTTSEEQIRSVKELESIQSKLIDIKKGDLSAGILPSEDLKKKLSSLIAGDRRDLELVFKATVAKAEATKSLRDKKLVRTVSLPAARLTKTGTPVFETAKGSQRSLQRFGTFKTGFEKIYEELAEKQALVYSKGYAEKIRKIGVRPTGLRLDAANKLAEEMLVDFASVNLENFNAFREQVGKATQIKAGKLGGTNKDKLVSGVTAALSSDVGQGLQPAELNKVTSDFIDAMKKAGLSAYDVVKTLDKIEFENVYDILLKVLKGTETGLQPLKNLAKNPLFDKGIRQVETATQQVVQSLPLIEPGRPRRGFQQSNVLNLLTRTSDVYSGEKPTDLKPTDQLQFIKDLNVRLNELVSEAKVNNDNILNEGIRTISTLGLPESIAAKVDFYREGQTGRGTEHLGALGGVSIKAYTDSIGELAPLGAQFNNLGKNISGVTNALESSKSELDAMAAKFGASTVEGYGTEFPGLRSNRESELISSGRLGSKGSGFNVLAELRNTAGTMEDQILVSGRLADALTVATKTLVRPSPGGRVGGDIEGAAGVGEVRTGVIKDSDIRKVLGNIQEVLGVPEQYKGRADQAFIDEVRRAMTVLRGENVEVQQARLTEVFLNSFGRKFITRYGSKGVSVTPTGLGDEPASEALNIIKSFPKAKVKVLTKEERSKAGLGVAILPRSMGELLSGVLGKYEDQLEGEGFDVSSLRRSLVASGNKFIFELFKDAGKGLVTKEEAGMQQLTFQKASGAFKEITGRDLPGDKSAIQDIRNLFKKEFPKAGVFKEQAIDVRISSTGVAKRGLQPDVLEAVLGNIASVGKTGSTTVATRLDPETYKRLLGEKKEGGGRTTGEFSKLSKALGFETVGSTEQIRELSIALGKGKDPDLAKVIAQRAQALEEASNYYTTVIDEFGKERKSIVGSKFLSIVEETGATEPWRKKDIDRGIKGASVDIPVLSAYSTVFGESSSLLDEIVGSTNANQRKQLEFLKALQFMADETGTLQSRQLQFLETVSLNSVKYFDQTSGILSQNADALDPRDLKNTLFDLKKFPKPFFVDLPQTGPGAEPGKSDPFYVPGALARGTYSEELVAGDRGIEDTGRRLQHVVNMAKKATELLDRPATIQAEIENLQQELQELLRTGDPRAAQTQAILSSRQDVQKTLLSGEGEVSSTIKRRVTDTVAEYLKEAQGLKFKQTPEATSRLNDILTIVKNALSTSEAPDEAFRLKTFAPDQIPLAPGASEVSNVEAFLERQKKFSKTENLALADAIGKASDLLLGKSPSSQDAYNTVLKGIAEISSGELENVQQYSTLLLGDNRFKGRVNNDPGNILSLLEEKQNLAKKEVQATEDKMFRLAKDIKSGSGLELASRLGIDIDRELQFKYEKALDGLQKAKIDYFHSLADTAIGKKGAIGTAVFSRKFPAVMKKAVVAIVDKTDDFAKFRDSIKNIQLDLPAGEQDTLAKVISEIDILSKSHKKKIATQTKAGFPVLKQHELGIPSVTAKKLPVDFQKQFTFTEDIIHFVGESVKETKGTLFDLLKYAEELQELVDGKIKDITLPTGEGAAGLGKYVFKGRDDASDIKQKATSELDRINPFVESLRYPFTGTSSIVPYKAKLLGGGLNKDARNTFAVPGTSDFDINEFNENIKSPVEGIIDVLNTQREAIFKTSDIAGTPLDEGQQAEVARLTKLMNSLAKAVSEVTPKYAAHTSKLDFDGDAIAVHTAQFEKSRNEIRKHYQTVAEFGKGVAGADEGLQEAYRTFFTADALKSQAPTGTAVLAEMQEIFLKKVGEGQGFDFLIKPYLTGQAIAGEETPTLEYAGKAEKLSILGLSGGGIRRQLEGAMAEAFSGVEVPTEIRTALEEALASVKSPFDNIKEELESVTKKGDTATRTQFAADFFTAIEKVDAEFSTSYATQLEKSITGKVFESKFQSAIEQQLAKVQAGIQVEGLYRVGQLVESNIGFGAGAAGTGTGIGTPSGKFTARNPNLQILGGSQQAIIEDFYAKFSESLRFAIQQGQDVKKGGSATVATELVANISRGAAGVEDLWSMIIDESQSDYSQLLDFSKVADKVSKQRLGGLPTDTIRKELTTLYEARSQEYSPAELATADRDKIIELAVEASGLRSFFDEMALQVKEAAVEGIIKQVSQYSPEKRSRIGDPESYARSQVAKEIEGGGINIREHITAPQAPLYSLRTASGPKSQLKKFSEKYGKPVVPANIQFLRKSPDEIEGILDKYREAKATAQNIQDAFNDSLKSEGRGAYNKLVRSTLDNIKRDQEEIEQKFKRLGGESFVAADQQSIKYMDNLVDRVSQMKELPELTEEVLSRNPEEQARELEHLADLVGVPTLTREEKLDVSSGVLGKFRKQGEKLLSADKSLSKEDISSKADEYATRLSDAAVVVYEMDRILDVLATRAKEGITLLSLFPTSGKVGAAPGAAKKSYKFTPDMFDIGAQGQAMREKQRDLYGPAAGEGSIFGEGGGGMLTAGGGVVPVHIQSIAQGIGVMFGGGTGPTGPDLMSQLNPEFAPQQQAIDKLAKMRSETDQHGEAAIRAIQSKIKERFKDVDSGFDRHSGRFDDPKFKELQGKYFPDTNPDDYEQLKRKFFTTTLKTFSGSKFKAGGGDVGAVLKDVKDPTAGHRRKSQLESIAKGLVDTEGADLPVGTKKQLDPNVQAAFDIGSALHAKLQRKIKNELGDSVDIEKFVFLRPQEFVSAIEGPITGFIDLTYKNAIGEIEKISDIKTTGETFAKFENISKLVPEEGIELAELLNKDMPGHIRQKLEEYRTQLNVYLAALKQQSKLPGGPKLAADLVAQIDFIPSEDTELKTPARSVRFSFDESRLKEDLETLHEARQVVKKYVLNLDTELKDVPEDHRALVDKLRKSVSGKSPGVSSSRTLESFQLEEELDKMFGVTEHSDKFINDYVNLSRKVFNFMQGQENVYKEVETNYSKSSAEANAAAQIVQGMRKKPVYGTIDPSKFTAGTGGAQGPPVGVPSKDKVKSFIEPLKTQLQAIQELHDGSIILQAQLTGLDYDNSLSKMHAEIQDVLGKGKTPPTGPKFTEIISALTQGNFIGFQESITAYKLWRIAMGDFLIRQAREAEKAFDLANEKGTGTREFGALQQSVERLVGEKGFIRKSLGKSSDIYTRDRRFLLPDKAEEAGVFASPKEIFERSAQPFGEDEFTRGVYKDLKDKLEAGTLGAPADEIRKIVEQLADLDREAQRVLESVDLFERMGSSATDAWDFEKMAKRARVLREALSQYSKFNLSDEFQVDVEKKFQVRSLLQYLKQIEQVYGRIDLGRLKKGPFGEYETGAVKVPTFLPPAQQQALQRRNIQKFRKFAERPEEEGGPRVGESFSYFAKVTDQAGNVLKNVRVDFKKYGEAVDESGKTVGKFSETQVDLIDKMHMSGGTFRSATKRVIMWGAAATLVYGGVQALKDSLGELADIEVGIAQLRMVMNPLETDFDSLTKSAVSFAKSYGVGVREVIGSMKIFAQQGLSQSEVIDRTKVSTLAANVSTLSAGDATEALTAAMKVFGNELGSADMALDAWSETEARHAITAADMANAIKKSAAAAKNAGFTFNELNGIVAGIGSVTRQTGKEVGTAMRFIARRIFSEKGPSALAEIGIPTVTGDAENRRGFDILSDLSMKWDELTNAQKLNIAQSLGGTRQYNALLVAMDNWDEVLEAIEDSTNSKGSAERRNVEIMKTYEKQLEQTKAAATELKLELGKFVFPVFKTGLKALRLMFEFMSSIPTPIKAAGVALGLFFTYASKGLDIFKGLEQTFSQGQSVIGNFVTSVQKEFSKANFEIFGEGFGPQLEGLKTFAKGAAEGLKVEGLSDLHSGFGKLVFSIKSAGDAYNEFLAATGRGAEGAGGGIEEFGRKFKNTAKVVDYSTDVFQLLGLSTGPFISAGTQIVESLAKGTGLAIEKSGKLFGATGQKVAEFLSDSDPGLFKSIAPLAITLGTMGLALKGVAGALDRSRKSAQEYAQSVYNARRVEEDQIKELTHATRQYDRLQQRLEKINKLMTTPGLREQQQDSSNFESPLLALSGVQEDATKLGNELAQINNKLVIGYDEQGNAILRLTGSYKSYIESLQRASSLELAKTDIDVLKKFTESLTDTGFGESIKRVLKTALGEVPGLGGVLQNLVSVSPGKEMEVLTGEINDLLSLREKYPLTDAFDQDISKLQDALGKVKNIYDETTTDFKRTLAGIFKFEGAQNLDRDTIARLLADPELTKGFELLLEVEPKITTVNKARLADNVGKVRTEDVVGSEILKRIFPDKRAFIDYTSELTAAQVESAGIVAREGRQVASGDIVTFFPELAKEYNIAGAQAVVELKKGTDGVYEAFATYINSKTLEVEQKGLDDPGLLGIVDRIFPSGRIQSELENRLDALNTFVSGAGAGLVGVDSKKFKKDFDLGSRFYSELPTTTVLQADKGFNIQSGQFGALPQLQQEWARMTKDFFIEPMAKYNREVESLTKNTLDGLDDAAQLSRQKADELYDQQSILRNNQVVVQFAAVFADLSKAMEESSRALHENLAVEKARQDAVKITSGLLRGVPEGFDAIDTGIRKIQDLSVKQFAAISSPGYRQLAGNVRTQQVSRDAAIGQLDALQKARVAIETIVATQGGLGSIIGPDAGPKSVEGFIQKTVALQDIGMATLSHDINNLDDTSSRGFDSVVAKLETMIANQGDFTGFEEAVSTFESGKGFSNDIAKQLHKVAEARDIASGRGDAETAAVLTNQIDRMVDVLISKEGLRGGQDVLSGIVNSLGFSKARGSGLSTEEFQQRALRRLQPNELLERFKTEGKADTGLFAALRPFQSREQFGRTMSGDSFADSDDYKKLVKLQEQANKVREKSLLDAKTILKGSVAITTFEAFNKKHSSKVLDTLKGQLATEESNLSSAGPGSNIPEMQKNIESLNRAIKDQEKNLQFHGLVSSMTKITGGVTALSKVLGVSETNLKRVNVGAVGLYLAMQAASKVTGKDMPESAREFGGVLKEAIGELKEGGDPSRSTLKRLRDAGSKFEEAYGERVKESTGKTREAIDKQIKERLKGMKDLSEAEIQARAKQLRKEAAGGEGAGITALIAALSAATLAGTFYETSGRGTQNAELERLAQQTSEVFNDIVRNNTDAAEIIADELVNQVKAKIKDSITTVSATPQNQLLDVAEQSRKALELLDDKTKATRKSIEKASKAIEEFTNQMYKFELLSEINKSMRDFVRTMAEAATEFEVRRNFGGAGILNSGLRGFAGDTELPIQTRQMSTQQRLFSTMGSDFQDSVSDYSYGLQTISSLVDRLAQATQRRREFIENNIEDPDVWESLEREIDATKESITNATNVLGPFGTALNNIVQYADTVNKLNDSFNDIAAKQAIDTLPGIRQYRDDMDKLLGGSHPTAAIGITPEQERMGRGVGVQLRDGVSTRYDLERVQLLDQRGRTTGQERQKLNNRLRDLPEGQRRDVESYRQRTEIGRLKEQQAPFEQALVEVQQLRQRSDLPEEVDASLKAYQDSIVNMLKTSAEKMSRVDLLKEVGDAAKEGKITFQQAKAEMIRIAESGPKQFRGTLVTGTSEIEKQRTAVYEQLVKELPTREMSDMKVAITDPIVEELNYQTELLKTIAEKGLDIDADALTRPTVAPFAAEKFQAPEKPGFFSRAISNLIDEFRPSTHVRRIQALNDRDINKAAGGAVFGEGGPRADKIPAMLSNGEFVIKSSSASKLGLSELEYMNKHGKIPKMADGGLMPASNLKIRPAESLEQQTWQDNLRDNPAWQMLMEITGVAPSFRLTKQIKDLSSVVLKPQTAFEWADRVAGMATNTLEIALAAVDLAGATGAVSSVVGKTVGSFFTKVPKAVSKFTKPLRHQIGTLGEPDLDTLARLPEADRIKWVMQQEGIDPAKLGEMTAATDKLLGDVAHPTKELVGFGKRKPEPTVKIGGVKTTKGLLPAHVKLANKKFADFTKKYPDVASKMNKPTVTEFVDDTVGGFFAGDDLERLSSSKPYNITLDKKLFTGEEGPNQLITALRHETWHGIGQYARDAVTTGALKGKISPQFKKMTDFMDTFGKRKAFSDRAALDIDKANFGEENFAEFARMVDQGKKGDLVDEFKKIFDPKHFQTGVSAFAEGGLVGKFTDFMLGKLKPFLGQPDIPDIDIERNVKSDKFPGKAGSYLRSKETTKELLDAVDPNNFGMGGRVKRKHFAEGGTAEEFTDEIDFLKNKAYQVGVGEVLTEQPNRSPKAMFAEETASVTGSRFGKEATALHRAKQELSASDIMAANITRIQRENRKKQESDPRVREALRFPGLKGDNKKLGLFNVNLDKRTGLVGDESLSTKFQSFHDLREIEFQDMKRRIDAGEMPSVSILKGMVATAGEDPGNKAASEKAAIERKALRSRLFDIEPGDKLFREAGHHYGRETELLLPIYHKLKKMAGKEGVDAKTLRQFDQAASLLGKESVTGSADTAILSQLVRADKEGAFMTGPKAVIKSDNIRKAIEQAKTMQDLQKVQQYLLLVDSDPEKAAELSSKMGFVAQTGSTGDAANDKNKKELSKFGKFIDFLRGPFKPGGIGHIKKADGGSIPFFQSGGVISQSGPIYAHKGEVVIPKGFAEGGLVENSNASAALREGTIKLEDNGLADKIAEKIREAIESADVEVTLEEGATVKLDPDAVVPVSIPEDATVKVDTTNVTVGVDSGQTTVPVDVSAAADAIGDAIARALSSASVDVNVNQSPGQAVGADGIDRISAAVSDVQDKLIAVKDELETKIETVRVDVSARAQSEISSQVEAVMSRVQQDINEHRNTISNVTSKITRLEYQTDNKIREVDRVAKDAQNLAQRPPIYTPLI